jgi:hypothetical protein
LAALMNQSDSVALGWVAPQMNGGAHESGQGVIIRPRPALAGAARKEEFMLTKLLSEPETPQ